MHTLVLIRHAMAEDRETWARDDDAVRPLTDAGHVQARRIAKAVMKLIEGPPDDAASSRQRAAVTLRSSPALRCVQPVEPLAERAGLRVGIDDSLMEGREIEPPALREVGMHIICAHGDNIPWLLQKLRVEWDGRCKKGSIWLLRRDAHGRVIDAAYQTIRKD